MTASVVDLEFRQLAVGHRCDRPKSMSALENHCKWRLISSSYTQLYLLCVILYVRERVKKVKGLVLAIALLM